MEEEEPVSIESTTNESTIEVHKDDDDKDIQEQQESNRKRNIRSCINESTTMSLPSK